MTDISIADLASTATAVGAQHTAMTAAIDSERAAEAALLEAAIDAVRPALRALSSRLQSRYYCTSGANGCNPVERADHFTDRGLVLVDDYGSQKDRTGNRGDYRGTRLVVLSDGQLARLERGGSWSHWQGEDNEFDVTLTLVTPLQAVKQYALADILASLRDALQRQLDGAAPKRTAAAQARAEKLTAIAALARK